MGSADKVAKDSHEKYKVKGDLRRSLRNPKPSYKIMESSTQNRDTMVLQSHEKALAKPRRRKSLGDIAMCDVDDVVSRTRRRKSTGHMDEISRKPPTRKNKCKLSDILKRLDYQDTVCEKCRNGDRENEMLLCDKCDRGYHMYCLCPILVKVPLGKWFCHFCSQNDSNDSVKEFPMVQKKIIDFFKIQKLSPQKPPPPEPETRKQKRRSTSLVLTKKKRKLLPYVPERDNSKRLKQMQSLATALTASKVEFSDELTYMPAMASRSSNKAALEKGGMQVMSCEDKETLAFCKEMQRRGECPPLMVVHDSREGFTVETDSYIKDLTIITEYTGDVDYLRNREDDDGDCMMTLLSTGNRSKDLVICPDKRGNIARFINGINNHTPQGRKKQNLKCVRYNIDGESRVLLVALKDIAKGERLYYDYNGYEQEYPTEHFV